MTGELPAEQWHMLWQIAMGNTTTIRYGKVYIGEEDVSERFAELKRKGLVKHTLDRYSGSTAAAGVLIPVIRAALTALGKKNL